MATSNFVGMPTAENDGKSVGFILGEDVDQSVHAYYIKRFLFGKPKATTTDEMLEHLKLIKAKMELHDYVCGEVEIKTDREWLALL